MKIMEEKVTFLDLINLNNKDSEKLLSIVKDNPEPSQSKGNGSVFETKAVKRHSKVAFNKQLQAESKNNNLSPVFTTLEISSKDIQEYHNGDIQSGSDTTSNAYEARYSQEPTSYSNQPYHSMVHYGMPSLPTMPQIMPQGHYIPHDLSNIQPNGYSIPQGNYEGYPYQPSPIYHQPLSTVPHMYPEHNSQRVNCAQWTDPMASSKHRSKKYKCKPKVNENAMVNYEYPSYMNGNLSNNYVTCVYPVNPGYDPLLTNNYMPPPYSMTSVSAQQTYSNDNYSEASIPPHFSHMNVEYPSNYVNGHTEIPQMQQYPVFPPYDYTTFIPNGGLENGFATPEHNNVNNEIVKENFSVNVVADEEHEEATLSNGKPDIALQESETIEKLTSEVLEISIKENNDVTPPMPTVNGTLSEGQTVNLTVESLSGQGDVESKVDIKPTLSVEKKPKKKKRKKRGNKDIASGSSAGDSGNNTRSTSPSCAISSHEPPKVVADEATNEVVPKVEKEQPAAWGKKRSWSTVFNNAKSESSELAVINPVMIEDKPCPKVETSHLFYKGKVEDALNTYKAGFQVKNLLPRGLTNKSFWCYTNCLLQALMTCPAFLGMLQIFIEKIPNLASLESFPFLSSFAKFVNLYSDVSEIMVPTHKGKTTHSHALRMAVPCEPSCIYNLLVTVGSFQFQETHQQDAHEALNFLLNGLHEEIADCLTSQGYVPADVASDGDEWHTQGPKGKSCLTRTTPFHETPFSEIFWGEFRSMQTASGSTSANIQPFNTLLLDVQSPRVRTLEDAFDQLVSKEEIAGYTCSKTKKETTLVKQGLLQSLPKVLILHLNRFTYGDKGLMKDFKRVDFEQQLVIRKDLIYQNRGRKDRKEKRSYTLFAVVKHEGPMANKGHYICEVNHGGNRWLHCDDSNVKVITLEDVLRYDRSQVPYLLFYQRNDTIHRYSNGN